MKTVKRAAAIAICLLAVSGFLMAAGNAIMAQEENMPGIMTADQVRAQNEVIIRKLDEILKGQKEVMEGMESLKQEMNVLKIRVTQQQ
ncbi:MAG: hypothetical protein WC592_06095 [Candidatus Omnitrophota bacterium]